MYRSISRLIFAASHPDSGSFAEGRDGILLSDGAGAVLLKPLSKAVRDNDNVLAIIRSTISSYVDSGYVSAIGASSPSNPDTITDSIKKHF